MDHYTAEKYYLERHQRLVRAAEARARLMPGPERPPGARRWVASSLRKLADRLDDRGFAPHLSELSS